LPPRFASCPKSPRNEIRAQMLRADRIALTPVESSGRTGHVHVAKSTSRLRHADALDVTDRVLPRLHLPPTAPGGAVTVTADAHGEHAADRRQIPA
jgi:hypothetical protein